MYPAVHTLNFVDNTLCGKEMGLCIAMLLPAEVCRMICLSQGCLRSSCTH